MKPRPVESEVLTKARNMAARLDALEKAKCDCGKEPCECQSCPKCGGKMAKMGGCMKAGCGGPVQKAEDEQTKEKITEVNPHFLTETGGQTRTAYYSTRDRPIETEDHKPKRAKDSSKVSLESLGSRLNPHEGTGADREDAEGGPVKKAPEMRAAAESGAPVVCAKCGGTEDSGCGVHPDLDIFACPQFRPLR